MDGSKALGRLEAIADRDAPGQTSLLTACTPGGNVAEHGHSSDNFEFQPFVFRPAWAATVAKRKELACPQVGT